MDVFCTSPWIPFEWIAAHGLNPRGVWSSLVRSASAVPEGACAFARATMEFAHESGALIVFGTSCDQMRRAADFARDSCGSRCFLFNLPATWGTSAAHRIFAAELDRLGRFLVSAGGRSPVDHELEAVMQQFDQRRHELRNMLKHHSARSFARAIMDFFSNGLTSEPAAMALSSAGGNGAPMKAPGLALAGGPFLPSHWPLLDAIEAAGGRIALNATETGERCLLPALSVSDPSDPPLRRLIQLYLDHAIDAFHRPDTRLYDWLAQRIEQRCVRGIVLWSQVGCDLWRAQGAMFREAFQLPVLVLDSTDVNGVGVRDITRVSAFVESLR